MRTLAAIFLTLVLLPACNLPSGENYIINRGGDIADVLRGHVMVGKGAAWKGEFSRLFHFGGGWYEAKAWGLANREFGAWNENITTYGLILGEHRERNVWDMDRISGSYGWIWPDNGGVYFQEADPENPLDLLTVRYTVFLFIGFDIEVRIGEVIDFLAGIFQFDPANDDGDYTGVVELQ